jgi:spore coat protein U-like protein
MEGRDMKKLILAVLAMGATLGAPATQAQTASGTFNVNVTLTPVCTLSAITAIDFAYTSLQAGVANGTNGNFSVTCTNTLGYTIGLQQGSGAVVPPGAATIGPITDDAVNLTYSLGLSGGTAPGGATGSGVAQNYNVTGTMAGGQGGTCATGPTCSNALATNRTHTLIVAF